MAFGKLLSDIAFSDIEQLQKNDVRESVVLEYKSQFKSGDAGRDDVLKEISAFANTFGGYLIFGIEDKGGQERGQIKSIPGVDPVPNLKQTLVQWAVEWVYPPLVDIEVSDPTPVGKQNKVCYVVHVPASMSAPHFVLEREGCYVRVGEHSMTFEPKLATLDEVLRLTDRRKAIIQHRESIVQTALTRWEARARRELDGGRQAPGILLWAVPQFPSKRLLDASELHDAACQAGVKYASPHTTTVYDTGGKACMADMDEFPWGQARWFSQQDAVVFEDPGPKPNSHLEVSAWGSVFLAQHLFREQSYRNTLRRSPHVCRPDLIVYPLLYLLFLRKLLRRIGFDAQVLGHVELRNIRGVTVKELHKTWQSSEFLDGPDYACSLADDTVSWEETLTSAKLAADADLRHFAVVAYRRLAFGVGCLDAYENPSDDKIIEWGVNFGQLDRGNM